MLSALKAIFVKIFTKINYDNTCLLLCPLWIGTTASWEATIRLLKGKGVMDKRSKIIILKIAELFFVHLLLNKLALNYTILYASIWSKFKVVLKSQLPTFWLRYEIVLGAGSKQFLFSIFCRKFPNNDVEFSIRF